jgi:hypothetical protein
MRYNLPLRYLTSVLLASCASFLFAGAAQASIIQTQSFSGSYTITDTTADGVAVSHAHQFGTLAFNTFDTSQGVLTNVIIRVRSRPFEGGAVTQTTTISGTNTTNGLTRGVNHTNFKINAPGIGTRTLAQAGQSHGCITSAGNGFACSSQQGPQTVGRSGGIKVAAADLALYTTAAGPTYNTRVAGALSANDKASNANFSSVSDTYTVQWSGYTQIIYRYDMHSDGSFNSATSDSNSLTIDLGTLDQHAASAGQAFDIFNLVKMGDPNAFGRAGMDFLSLISTGDAGSFLFGDGSSTNLSADSAFGEILGLAAGSSAAFTVALDTSNVGLYSATYDLTFIDTAIGAGLATNTLHLTVMGNVSAPEHQPGVPEPGALSLLSGGLMLLGGFRLRRKSKKKT